MANSAPWPVVRFRADIDAVHAIALILQGEAQVMNALPVIVGDGKAARLAGRKLRVAFNGASA
jgi:hypothetical protein